MTSPAGPHLADAEREALLLDPGSNNGWALPYLLSRAGFAVDVVSTSPLLRLSNFVRRLYRTRSLTDIARFASEHIAARGRSYDWIITTDDDLLAAIRSLVEQSRASPELLPVLPGANRTHLYSKIGLSRIFSEHGIRTPPYRIANRREDVATAARELGYPVMIKADASSGGAGTVLCMNEDDLAALRGALKTAVLVQKHIAGQEIDLSGIFLGGDLVHLSYSIITGRAGRFGISNIRHYKSSAMVDERVFDELSEIGRALGAHGFTSLTCIEADDGSGRYYFECDMRPNVWTDFSVYYGEDSAPRIRNWFVNGTRLTKENAISARERPTEMTIPYFLRLPVFDLLTNRYDAWKFIPSADPRVVHRLFVAKAVSTIMAPGKRLLPPALVARGRQALTAAGVPPQ